MRAMEEEQGSFSIDDVCDGVCKKLVTRHPHILAISKRILLRKSFLTGRRSNSGEKGQKTATETLESVP